MENESKSKSKASPWIDSGTDFTRILALSDGVFAIALTLLALELIPPELEAARAHEELPGVIITLLPKFLVFALAFYLIILKWMAHRRIFEHITHYDLSLLWLNNLFLLLIAFMPVPAAVLGRHPQEPAALIFFGVTQIITTAAQWGLWGYAVRGHRFVDDTIDDRVIHFFTERYIVQLASLAIFTAVSLFSVLLALILLVGFGFGFGMYESRLRRERGVAAEP